MRQARRYPQRALAGIAGRWLAGARIGQIGAICLIYLWAAQGYAIASPGAKIKCFASYYTVASCKREGTSGIMANGRKLDDKAFTAASWDYPLGTNLRVERTPRPSNYHRQSRTGTVIVTVSDRGPAKRLLAQGRRLDLSKAAFQALAPLAQGIVEVEITEVGP